MADDWEIEFQEFHERGLIAARDKRDSAIEAAHAEYEQDLKDLEQTCVRLFRPRASAAKLQEQPTTSTEAIKVALRYMPSRFTRDQLFEYVREHFPSTGIRDNLPSCFAKMVRHRRMVFETETAGVYERVDAIKTKGG